MTACMGVIASELDFNFQSRIWGFSEGSNLNPSEIGTKGQGCPGPAMKPAGQAMSFLDQQLVLMRCVIGSEQLVNPDWLTSGHRTAK